MTPIRIQRKQMKPILFSTPMVQAILAGTKSQTRRIVPEYLQIYNTVTKHITSGEFDFHFDGGVGQYVKPKYQPGDILYTKEAYYAYGYWETKGVTKTGKPKKVFIDITLPDFDYLYLTGSPTPEKIETGMTNQIGWYKRNSLFMPREACRLFLEITDIRVERLQDISEEDAISEGVEKLGNILLWTYKDYLTNNQVRQYSARQSYMSLWDKINGPGSWEKNPFVWKITFKKISNS
jgi:hypothetical protein